MAKRPAGFGKASLNKKNKPVEEELKADADVDIEVPSDIEDDEIAEVYGLYLKLREDRDPSLARGLIHECDELLRNRDAAGETLPAKFHIIYGGALLTLAGANHEESFGSTGLDRIETGIDTDSKDATAVGLAVFELAQYAHTQLNDDDGELNSLGSKAHKRALMLLKSTKCQAKDNVDLAKAADQLVVLREDLDLSAKPLLSILEELVGSTDKETVRIANKSLGRHYANEVAAVAEELEDLDEDEEPDLAVVKRVCDGVDKAAGYFRKALSDTDGQTYVLLAETWLKKDIGPDDDVIKEGIRYLKKAQLLGVPDLQEIIDDLENHEEGE